MSIHQGIARRAGIVAVSAALSLLTVACGSAPAAGHVSGTTTPPPSASQANGLADGTAKPGGPSLVSAANCGSGTTCYSPEQL